MSATTGERLPRPPYRFNAKDEAFLNDVQRGAFQFLWNAGNANTGMVPDRLSNPAVVSIAGVGFQLSALPIGVERGWVTREQAAVRAMKILASLDKDPAICKAGFFQHFLDADGERRFAQAHRRASGKATYRPGSASRGARMRASRAAH